MSNQTRGTAKPPIGLEYPLRFSHHAFDVHCYNTRKCKVRYAGVLQIDRDEPSPAPKRSDYRELWGAATHVGIDNFPAPAKVSWTASDGTELTADVDIASIFANERVLHHVPVEQLPEKTIKHADGPSIHLEINDRTLTVFMRQMVFLKGPADRPSPFREDLIQAWQKTF